MIELLTDVMIVYVPYLFLFAMCCGYLALITRSGRRR